VLIGALTGVALSDAKRASLIWLAGFEADTSVDVAAVITAPGDPGR